MKNFDFYKMEYESLREEILASQAARRNNEQVGMGLIAALYGWLTTTGAEAGGPLAGLAWWIAPVIAFGVAWRSNSLSNGVRKAGRYLATLETAMLGAGADGPPGWHVTLSRERAESAPGVDSEKNKTNLTWYVVGVVTLAIAGWVSLGPVALR